MENEISMIAGKVNKAWNVIIAKIKKAICVSKIARVIANYAILLNKSNNLMTCVYTGAVIYFNLSLTWHMFFNNSD